MTLLEYQDHAHSFATYGDNVMYPLLGLAEEAGEVCGKVAKYIRKHEGAEPCVATDSMTKADKADCLEFKEAITKELGDVLWMLSEVATAYGISLDEVAKTNISKLRDRKNRGVIIGEGDNR